MNNKWAVLSPCHVKHSVSRMISPFAFSFGGGHSTLGKRKNKKHLHINIFFLCDVPKGGEVGESIVAVMQGGENESKTTPTPSSVTGSKMGHFTMSEEKEHHSLTLLPFNGLCYGLRMPKVQRDIWMEA